MPYRMDARGSRMTSTPSLDSKLLSQDFGACDREPIHIPGSIQPHGLLLAVDPVADLIVQAAGNAGALLARGDLASGESLLGLTMEKVLGRSLSGLMRGTAATLLRDPIYLGTVGPFGDGGTLAVIAPNAGRCNRRSAARSARSIRRVHRDDASQHSIYYRACGTSARSP
jgi:hypothetical protein